MKKLIQLILVLVIIGVALLIAKRLIDTRPEAVKKPVERSLPVVEVITAKQTEPEVSVITQGAFSAPRESTLSAQVNGEIVYVSDQFEVGGIFKKGEAILKLDDTDYKTTLVSTQAAESQAQAAIKDAEVALEMEKARVAQAKRDWEKLGRGKEPSALLLRKPQIAAAESRILSAKANLEQTRANVTQAMRNLDRAMIKAPYDCQISMKQLDLGSLAAVGAPLCTVFELGSVEARVPITQEDAGYITVDGTTEVTASAMVGGKMKEWTGVIERSENRIDPQTRSTFMIAQFEGAELPPVGMFAKIEILGGKMEPVISIPRIALIGQNKVIVINEENQVNFKEVQVSRTSDKEVFLSGGVIAGERVCVTVLNTPMEGMEVQVLAEQE